MFDRLTAALSRAGARFAMPAAAAPVRKDTQGAFLSIETLGQPRWSARDYPAFAREGMSQNPVVYRAVRMVAESAASVPLLVYEGGREVERHPLADLVDRPNPEQSRAQFLETCLGHLLVGGNLYVEAVAVAGRIRELHALRPDRVRGLVGEDGRTRGYTYAVGGRTLTIAGDAVEGVRRLLHVRLFHPLSDTEGLSPAAPAAAAIDIHNAASRWNKALLDNAARPSGALVYTGPGALAPDQFDRLKAELGESFQGARNAGRPLLLEGGLDWKAMGLTPHEMDFIAAKHAAARDIALAFGVPPMLLGIPGDNTYANYQEANRTLWRQTVLPLLDRVAGALAGWLSPAWGEGTLALVPDLDRVDALSPEREALWGRIERASVLTVNEKRQALGYGPVAGGDRL